MTKSKPQNKTAHNSFIGAGFSKNTIYLFGKKLHHDKEFIQIEKSTDGFNFQRDFANFEIIDKNKRRENLSICSKFNISAFDNYYILSYQTKTRGKNCLNFALSNDLSHWKKTGKFSIAENVGMIVPDYKFKGKYVLFYGNHNLQIAFSSDLITWEKKKEEIIVPHDKYQVKIGTILNIKEGISLFYYLYNKEKTGYIYAISAIFLDTNNPSHVLWKSPDSIWEQPDNWQGKDVMPIGMTAFAHKLISFWQINGEIFSISHSSYIEPTGQKNIIPFSFLKKLKENPILKPIAKHSWESKATFNPGAIYEKKTVHLVYRAIGDLDMSVFGYASSNDGLHINHRLDKPVYTTNQSSEYTGHSPSYFPGPYISGGGGWGGCEDPRLTKLGNKIYMTYVSYDGINPPRVALTSINSDDFLSQIWNWDKPVLISPPGIADKNACIFPEKIDGKYVILHRIFPDILMDFVDDLNFKGNNFLYGTYKIKPRQTSWDSRKVGAGAPPIKTKYGWLLIYHSVGNRDSSRYKTGAMLLDLYDPRKVLYRSQNPILEPQEIYENEGFKYGVAYPCGAVIMDGQLIVYYGGADMFVCAATANLNLFLEQLMETGSSRLNSLQMN